MRNRTVIFVMIIVVLLLSSSLVYSIDITIGLGMPFYQDGIGILTDVSVRGGMYDLFRVDIPIYLGGGLGFHYARGGDNNYHVDVIDFGLLLSGGYLLNLDKVNLGFGLDLYFSYGSSFNNISSLGSLGANFRPNLTSTYSISDRLEIGAKIGYNAGIYNLYRGYIFFEFLSVLKL